MKARVPSLFGLLLVGSLLASCGGPAASTGAGTQNNLAVNETSVSQDTVAEPISINNCGNPASVEQTSEHSQTVTIEGGAELGFSAEVVKGSVEGKYISTRGVTKSQKVTAAPNTNMKFNLLWTEQINQGTVTATGSSGQATYRVSVPISVEQTSAVDLGCPDNTPAQAPTEAPPSAPTATPQVPPTEVPQVSLDTPPGSELQKGEYWRQNDISLILDGTDLEPAKSCAAFDFDLTNNSPNDLLLTILLSQFTVTDNTGRTWKRRALSHYVYCGDPGPWNDSQIAVTVDPGKSYWDAGYTTWIVSFDGPLTDTQITDLYVTVDGLARFSNAKWHIPVR